MDHSFGTIKSEPKARHGNHTADSGCRGTSLAWTGKLEVARRGAMASHQGFHHVGLVVPKRFGSEENVHQIVAADHLQDCGAGTEGAAAATPVSK